VFANGETYHIYNRGIDGRDSFTNKREYERAVLALSLYQYTNLPNRLSKILQMENSSRNELLLKIKNTYPKRISILSYCLMPNHFHFLLKQEEEKGIQKFASDFQNSYTRYFNLSHKRNGPLFLIQFKAKRVENDYQLTHLSRYIHLNPYTSFLVDNFQDLENYAWSSFKEFLYYSKKESISDFDLVLNLFGKRKISNYKKFVFDQKDYQRDMGRIKKLLFE